jgi:hypothetical protein
MELGKPQIVRVFHNDGVDVGDIGAGLDDVVQTSTSASLFSMAETAKISSFSAMRPWAQTTRRPGISDFKNSAFFSMSSMRLCR